MLRGRRHARAAGAYRLADRLLVHALHRTEAGLSVAGEPFGLLEAEEAPEALGAALRRALQGSREREPNPARGSSVTRALVRAARVTSYRRLQAGSRHCLIDEAGEGIGFTPTRNGGASGDGRGFHALPDRRRVVPTRAADAALGQALLDCFEDCTEDDEEGG